MECVFEIEDIVDEKDSEVGRVVGGDCELYIDGVRPAMSGIE